MKKEPAKDQLRKSETGPDTGDMSSPDPYSELDADPLIQEARATSSLGGSGGPREFFWGTVAPLTAIVCFGIAATFFLLTVWLAGTDTESGFRAAALVLAITAGFLMPLQYYLVRTGVERPLARLSYELLGRLPWRPERDVLFASLRRAVEEVRLGACEARERAGRAEDHARGLEERLAEKTTGEGLLLAAARAVAAARTLEEYGSGVAAVLKDAWPAEHVVLLRRYEADPDLGVVYHDGPAAGTADDTDGGSEGGGQKENLHYPKTNLPRPIREALHKGMVAEYGVPAGADPNLPDMRSFLALTLEHSGSPAAVLLLATREQRPATSSAVAKVRPVLSLGFSRVLLSEEREEAVVRDGLTGLFTHDHFLSVLRSEIARSNRYSRFTACLLLDIDDLHRVNDAHGARAGDRVITELARLVQELVRTTDTVARTGGGRLAVLLAESNADAAVAVGSRIREKVEAHPFLLGPSQMERITISGGVSVHPPQGVTALALVDAAAQNLSRAKQRGKNCIEGPAI